MVKQFYKFEVKLKEDNSKRLFVNMFNDCQEGSCGLDIAMTALHVDLTT